MKIIITESQYNRLFNELDDSFYGSVEETNFVVGDLLTEAEYQGRKVQLGKIMQGDVKKSKVYVKNDKGNVVKVNFGFGGKSAKGKRMTIKKNNPARRKSFRARHNCDNPGPRWKADIGLVELGNMDVKIKYDKLYSVFEKLMEPYSNLDHTEKSYDYWVQEKGRYVDFDTTNFYHDIEEDWENDDWVVQYQDEPGDEGVEEDLPILRYGENYSFPNIETMFNQYFDDLLKDWFKKTYGFEVKTIDKI